MGHLNLGSLVQLHPIPIVDQFDFSLQWPTTTNTTIADHDRCWLKWPLVPHIRPYALLWRLHLIGADPLSNQIFLGGCWGCVWLPKHSHSEMCQCIIAGLKKLFDGHADPQSPPKIISMLPIHSMHCHRDQGLMWGIRGPFLPAAAMVVMLVVCG